MRPPPLLLTLAAALALPAAALGQPPDLGPESGFPGAQADPPPQLEPAAEPAPGRMSIKVRGGQSARGLRYVAGGARVVVEGRSRPYVGGQVATLGVYRGGRLVATRRARIRRSRGGGRVRFSFSSGRKGLVRLVASHRRTGAQRAFRSRPVRVKVVTPQAGQGARGVGVLLLQRGLARLGFAVPVTGFYDPGTSRAVLAFRKANDLGRDGYATRRVFSLALQGRGAFKVRYPRAGRHVEFDWSRQLLALIHGGRPRRVYHASSGTASTPTVFGSFRFYRKQPGTNSLGMVQSNYFVGGYAIHGYKSVPNFPASHGCIRVPVPNAAAIDRQISLGQRIFVYR